MAEEHMKSPTTSEIIKTDEGNSAVKPRSSKNGRTPHYLKASGGSCHDNCKYGGTQISQTQPRNAIRGKMTRRLADELLLAEDVVVPGLARKPMTKPEILSNSDSQTLNIANVSKQEGPGPDHAGAKFMAKGKKKSEIKLESLLYSRTNSSNLHKIVKPGMASSGTKQVSPGASATFSSEMSGESKHRKKKSIRASQDTRTSKVAEKNLLVSSTTSNPLKHSSRSPRPRKGIASEVMSPLKNHSKNQNSTKNELVQVAKEVAVQEKTLYAINEETEHKPSDFTSTTTTFTVDDQNGSAVKMSPDQSLLLPQHLCLLNCLSPESQEEEFHGSSDYTDNEGEGCSDTGHGESDSLERAGTSQRPTQDRTNSMKKETCKAVDLNSQSGKVVVNTQAESSNLRRLKVRGGRDFGENQNPKANARRRTFKRRDEIEVGKNSSTASCIEVTLRHQDVQVEKGGLRLFNNMIEETASQLVKTRKGKVKALVGAFETVISLQETKDFVK